VASPALPTLGIEADLQFSVEVPGERTVSGVLTGSGAELELTVSDPLLFAGRSDARAVRGIADALAARGVSITVVAPSGPLVTLGAPHTPWWQRRVTGSRHIRIERGAGLWSLARGRARATAGALPASDLVPPAMVWPPAPTFMRRPRTVGTTHDPEGGGHPRLVLAARIEGPSGGTRQVFSLRGDVTTIGSDPGSDIVLPGLAARHAEVRHDERDEFLLVRLGERGATLVNGEAVDSAVLRTGSRVRLGELTLSFYREEYADHGRPYGGRVGGELGHQRPQPPRPQPSRPERAGPGRSIRADWQEGDSS
jgi:Inner membrane component of T3SS, cytoplasmic domain